MLLAFEERMGRTLHAGRDGDLFYRFQLRGGREEPATKTEAQKKIEEVLSCPRHEGRTLAEAETQVLRLLQTQVLAERPGLLERNPSWITSAYSAILRQEFPKAKTQSLAEVDLAEGTFVDVLGSFVWKLQHEFGIPSLPPLRVTRERRPGYHPGACGPRV
jgi:hypothetical protein